MTFPVVAAFGSGQTAWGLSHALTIPTGAVGELLLLIAAQGDNKTGWTYPAGWTLLGTGNIEPGAQPDGIEAVYYRVADGSEGATLTVNTSTSNVILYHFYRINSYTGVPVYASFGNSSLGDTTPPPPALTSGFGAVDTLWIAALTWANITRTIAGYPSGYTDTAVRQYGYGSDVPTTGAAVASARRALNAASETPGEFALSADAWFRTVTLAIQGAAYVAPPDVPAPAYTEPPAAGALIEIYANDPGGGRWSTAGTVVVADQEHTTGLVSDQSADVLIPDGGTATAGVSDSFWGITTWPVAGWQDVTPESVTATIRWGTGRADAGILSQPDADTWALDLFDPLRSLDPGNVSGPYFGDLVPGLPVRVSHRGIVIRTGIAESLGWSLADETGYIRVTSAQSSTANGTVPASSPLPNTLRARARAALSAVGLSVPVESDPAGGDPAVVARMAGTFSAWAHIADAALQVLHVPYFDANAVLRFRPWAVPLDRARVLNENELIDILTVSSFAGLYSTVRVQPADLTAAQIERAVTPLPQYGRRVYSRTEGTPDPSAWAAAVLADRGGRSALRIVPGWMRPLDARSVERLATIEAIERVYIASATADPDVVAQGIVVGGEVAITAVRGEEAAWLFRFDVASALLEGGPVPFAPLTEDGGTAFLTLDGGTATDFLYIDA